MELDFDPTMLVGCFGDWTGPGADGTLDDLVIFNTALSDAEIAAIVSSGQPVPEPLSLVLLVSGGLCMLRRRQR